MKAIHFKIILTLLFLISCSSSPDEPQTPSEATEENGSDANIPDPEAATLVFPENDTQCNEGLITSTTESNVNFQWTAAENTDSYSIYLTNLSTNEIITSESNTNRKLLKILRGTPYAWYVESKAEGTQTTAMSNTWRFFNEGPGIANYAPFPAEAVIPENGADLIGIDSTILEWSAADIDDDFLTYEVFFGTEKSDLPLLATYTEKTTEALTLTPENNYFWKVKTIDSFGNISISDIFEFNVN